jgi:signal transduction histidine kinase/ActR/RegA family two-component response regulator
VVRLPPSIRVRLPLSISALIAVVLAVFLWVAYREVEATLVRAGGARAENAANQLANLLERSAQQAVDELRRYASHADLVRFLNDPSEENRQAVVSQVSSRRGSSARRITVWDTAGSRRLDVALPPGAAGTGTLPEISTPPTHSGLSEFQSANDLIFSDAATAIVTSGPASRRLGTLAFRTSISVNPPGVLSQLVGRNATILLGNARGGAWTDLSHVVPAPPVDTSQNGIREYRGADGDGRLGAVAHIRGTPWAVWVEFRRSQVIAPARTFLNRMLVTAGIVVLLAAALVRTVTRRMTTPLTELTSAAESIAGGDYTRRVAVDRRDEIGRLGAAFNAMGGQIEKDISERRALEDQLRQSQKMEAIGRLAGGVAHDFNNLLTAILGYTNFVLEDLDKTHPVRRDVEEIRKAGESASSLTRQLLAFSRRQVLQPQIVDLNEIVRKMDGLLRRLIGEDITLSSRPGERLDPVFVDPGQMEQILLNLAVNARDAMPHGGILTIETANVLLDESYVAHHRGASVGPHVTLAVSDNGTGMTGETLSHVFEPFFTTKPRGEGTGLGLAMVYGIVKQSGGSIWVYSEPGKGTTFKISFPRAAEEEPVPAPTPVVMDALDGGETILVAEDQPEVRALAHKTLTRHGYTVLEARSGTEALEIVRAYQGPIHLLLTDVIMPVMSGRELVTELSRSHPEIRILYASGYTDDAIVRHGMLDPGAAFLQKPFNPRSLLLKIREVLDAPRPLVPHA